MMAAALGSPVVAKQDTAKRSVNIIWQDDGQRRALPDSLRRLSVSETAWAEPRGGTTSAGAWIERHHIDITSHKQFIREKLGADGYLSAAIEELRLESDGDAIILHLFSRRGPAYRLRSWTRRLHVGHDSLAPSESEARNFASLKSESTGRYREADIEQEVQRYLDFWEARGRLFARVEMDSLQVFEEQAEVALHSSIRPGPEVRLSRQLFPGISRNDPAFLARVTRLKEGQRLTPEELRNARLMLENTGLFRDVARPALLQEGNSFHLVFELEERQTNAFDLLVGYVPQEDGTGNTLIGNGELLLRNVFLSGSSLDIRFERLQQFVTRLDIGYEATYIRATPFGAGARFRLEQQDSTYQTREATFHGRYRLSSSTSLLANLRQRTSRADNTAPGTMLRALNATTLFTGLGVEYRQTDRVESPRRGAVARAMFDTGIKRVDDDRLQPFTDNNRWRQQEVRLSAQAYFNPFPRQVISPRLNGYLMLSPFYTETDLHKFGGAESLRGYREEQFRASRMIWADAEYRYLLDRFSYAFIFGALGYYERPELVVEQTANSRGTIAPVASRTSAPAAAQTETLYSYGFGFSYTVPVGIIRFSYALSPNDSFSNGKVHVGVQARL